MRRTQRHDRVAVAQQKKADLFAGQELFDEHPALLQVVLGVRDGGGAMVGDDDAFARGQAVGLDHVGGAELIDRGLGLGERAGPDRAPRRNIGGIHDALRERLRAFELRGGGARAEHGYAAAAHRVGDPGDKRSLGPDDDELDVVVDRVVGHDVAARRVEGHGWHGGRDPGVARSRGDLMRCGTRRAGLA